MSFQIFLTIYFLALAVEIFANLAGAPLLQYFSKPSLMLILLVYYILNTRKTDSSLKYLIILALVFAWLGDVLLLIDKHSKTFFVYGLSAFLIAHIFYIFYFWKIRRANKIEKFPNALVISTMLAASLAAFDFGKQDFGKISVAGTLLFIVSDSILAINRFAAPFELGPVFVMATYALAQLLIAEGSLRNLQNLSHR